MSSSRPQPTVADYMAIALSPALIIVLVGSLAFFMLTVFYAGAFEQRMYWTTACFVFAAVLISRISIVEGAERASIFGIALGGVAGLAMMRFTAHPLGAWFVLGVIWWAASHLVWNCTLVDDEDDASGAGLLEAAGLDTPLADERGQAPADENAAAAARPHKRKRRKAAAAAPASDRTAAVPAAAETAQAPPPRSVVSQFFSWWQRSLSRSAPPGLTVVYFSLAALPIFGVGQKFVQLSDRQYVFQLMVRYVASALGLLLTTSFLGLRRYLRQRRLEMPVEMAGTWLGVGAAMAAAILLVALLIPRPNPEYAISSLTGLLSSPVRQASQHAPLRDSPTEGDSQSTAAANDKSPTDQPPPANPQDAAASDAESRAGGTQVGATDGSQPPTGGGAAGSQQHAAGQNGSQSGGQGGSQDRSQSASNNSSQSSGQGGAAPSGGEQDGKQEAGDRQGAQSAANDQSPSDGRGGEPSQSQQAQGSSEDSGGEQDRAAREQTSQGNGEAAKGEPGSKGASGEQPEAEPQANDRQKQSAPTLPKHRQKAPFLRPPSLPQSFSGMLLWLLKMCLYLVVLIVGIYCLIRHWEPIKAFLARAWQELRALWQAIFGGRRGAAAPAAPDDAPTVNVRLFASFADPFASGAAGKNPPNRIVQYTFEALEAWSAERGLARLDEETPLEFAGRIAGDYSSLAEDVQVLASLYARVAYARETLTPDTLTSVERLWGGLRTTPARSSPAGV